MNARMNVSQASVLVIASKFNELIVRNLYEGCMDELLQLGFRKESVQATWVPGAFEIPGVASIALERKRYQAVIALGAVIRGETPHFDFVAGEAARGLMQLSIDAKVPVIFGILTTDNAEQALMRCGIKGPNKGREAARAAFDTLTALAGLGL